MKKVIIIGSGFSGMSAAAYLARAGYAVTVVEKNSSCGGRARKFCAEGFTFDMGPSWYWMPGVFEKFFASFGKKVEDYYSLKRLDPSYRIYWENGKTDVPADYGELKSLFESIEAGSSAKLDVFLEEAKYKYEVGINELVQKPSLSLKEFFNWNLFKGVLRLDVFTSMKKHVRKYFKDPRLIQLMEFPVLFLGALPARIPALYSLMNYADLKLGTWYPEGGMFRIAEAMESLARELNVNFSYGTTVTKIVVQNDLVTGVEVLKDGNTNFLKADVIIGAGDYHHLETLVPKQHRSYSEDYWDKRVMAPSTLIYYVGLNKKLKGIQHHNLFFDVPFDEHGRQIYTNPGWPDDPLFYVCAPTVTDASVAPAQHENLFFLVPVASGLENDDEELRKRYFNKIVKRFEKHTGESVEDSIIYYRSYSVSDFKQDYNAYKGNAYGLANTLSQTAILKPSMKSRKIKNLYYTGQLTVPGPGVPPALISGEVVSREVIKSFEPI